jgi:catechol 2,3-dioxygenase-like lactoylglutathione lyase family enzyme
MHREVSIYGGPTHVSCPTRTQRQSDIDEAVEFYSKLFGTQPAKRQPGYANFAIADPPLKLVLIEDHTHAGTGGRRAQPSGRRGRDARRGDGRHRAPERQGLATEVEEQTTCCYAVQDKVWVNDPDGAPWEVYTVLADAPAESGLAGDGSCCVPEAVSAAVPVTVGATQTGSSCC